MVSFAEGLAGIFPAVVIRPTPNDGVELPDQVTLGCGFMFVYYLFYPYLMAVHGLLAGFDDGLKADLGLVFPSGFPAVSFARRELTDFKTQEGKTNPPFVTMKGMGNPGFARLEFQPHLS